MEQGLVTAASRGLCHSTFLLTPYSRQAYALSLKSSVCACTQRIALPYPELNPLIHSCSCKAEPSRNDPSLAVARNYGIASSSLNADVNAFDRLHIVRSENSSC